jgi:histidine triad (HIT) family protein
MEDCIFCKIAAGEIPSATIYEDDDFRVILDLGPATKGHALILPKEHYANITEIPDELLQKAIVLAKKVVTYMMKALPCDGYNVVQNNGEAAGQTVFHFHIHLIPRYKGDGAGVTWQQGKLTDEWKAEILEKTKGLRGE